MPFIALANVIAFTIATSLAVGDAIAVYLQLFLSERVPVPVSESVSVPKSVPVSIAVPVSDAKPV